MCRWIFALLVLACVCLGLAVAKSGDFLIRAVNKSCGDCALSAKKTGWNFFPLSFHAEGVEFSHGRQETTLVRWKVNALKAPLSFRSLLGGEVKVGVVELSGLDVEVIEEDGESPRRSEELPSPHRGFFVAGAKINDAEFRYRMKYREGDALLRVHSIQGEVSAFGGKETVTEGKVTARLEGSGLVDLKVRTAFFSDVPDVSVALELRGQKLAELNPFFEVSDGIRLKGILRRARGEIKVEDQKALSRVQLSYEGLDLHFQPSRDRSGSVAFFSNFLKGLQIDDSTRGEKPKDRDQSGVAMRRKGESMVSFLIRALREVAFKIVAR